MGRGCEEGVMIPHMPLLREAEAFSIPHGASDCARAGEARHRIQILEFVEGVNLHSPRCPSGGSGDAGRGR